MEESQPKCSICYKVVEKAPCTQCSQIFTSVITSLTKVSANPFSNIDNLVFQGGGVKGAAYLGVLEQLNKESDGFLTRVKRVAGSSAGSIVALYLALNLDLKYIGVLVKEKYSNLLDEGMGLIIKGENKKVRAKVVFLTAIQYFKELKDEIHDEKKNAKALQKIKKIPADIKSYYTSDLWIHEKFLFNKVIGDRAAEAFTSCILDLLGVSYVIKSAKRKNSEDEKVEFEEELIKGFREAQENPATGKRLKTAGRRPIHELEKVPGAQGERKVRRPNNDSDKESSESEEGSGNSKRQKSKTRGFRRNKESKKESLESEEGSDDDSDRSKPKARGVKRTKQSDDESSESEENVKVYEAHTVRQVQIEKKTIRQGERAEVQESQIKTVRHESHKVTAKRTSGPELITEFDLSDENDRKLLHYALAELVLKIKDFQEDNIEYKYDTSKVQQKMDEDELVDHLEQKFDISKDQSKKEPLGVFSGDKVKHRLIIEPIEVAFKKFEKKTGPHGPTFAELAAAKDKKEKKLFKDLYVTAFNCATNRTEVFSAEHTPNVFVADAVRASMAIPGFFKPVHISQKVGETVENRKIYFEKKNEVKHEDVLFMDGGILDNYPLWIFDDIKYLLPNVKLNAKGQEARTQRFSIQNQKTLGFKLLDKKTLDRYTKPYIKDNFNQVKRTNEASQATGNKWTFVFGSLLGAKMDQEENEFIKFGNCPRTVYVDNADVSAVAFDMDEKVVDKLIKNGEESVKKYKERYEKRFLHEGEEYPAYTC